MKKSEMSERKCAKCKTKRGVKKCSACKNEYYCSRECQREDWKRHKVECKKSAKKKSETNDWKKSFPSLSEYIKYQKKFVNAIVNERWVKVKTMLQEDKDKMLKLDAPNLFCAITSLKLVKTLRIDIVKELIRRGVEVDTQDDNKRSVLHFVTGVMSPRKTDLKIAEMLIENGADVNLLTRGVRLVTIGGHFYLL